MALSQALPFIDAFVKTVAEARANREMLTLTRKIASIVSTFQHGAQTAGHAVGTQRAASGAVEAASA
jgi:hypothetical protein